jgi:hypothetical protein
VLASGPDKDGADSFVADFNSSLTEFESAAFMRGFNLASDLAKKDADKYAELLLQVSAAIRGKDVADGRIVTEIVPDPAIYGWNPS